MKHTVLGALATGIALMAGAVTGGSAAQAADTYHSGSSIGAHADAYATCANPPYGTLTAKPWLGTTKGWEFGQSVAWKYTVVNAVTGQYTIRDTQWRTAYIRTMWFDAPDYYGRTALHSDTYASGLPEVTWRLPAGRYVVYVDYAWLTNSGWSYVQARTDWYYNQFTVLGTWQGTSERTCNISG